MGINSGFKGLSCATVGLNRLAQSKLGFGERLLVKKGSLSEYQNVKFCDELRNIATGRHLTLE